MEASRNTSLVLGKTGARPFIVCGALFLAAAAVLMAVRFTRPIDRAWWLVAYLSLVGGVAQLLLGPGLLALARQRRVPSPSGPALGVRLLLWNVGTLLVAAANMIGAMTGVVAGSVVLLAALTLFTRDLRAIPAAADEGVSWWHRGYRFLLLFLALSVAVGTALAFRTKAVRAESGCTTSACVG